MNISNVINEVNRRAQAANPRKNGDYMGSDNLLYCGKCNTPKQIFVEELKEYVPNGIVSCLCKCALDELEAEQNQEMEFKKRQYAEQIRRIGITDPAYRNASFASDKGFNKNASDAAKWYVDNFSELYKSGQGLMFMGGAGTGKTFLACCIANALIDNGIIAWVTTLMPLLRMAGNFNTYESTIDRVETVDLLVLDDFGTVNASEYNLSLLFDIVDARYRSGKPLIITTNLRSKDFKNPAPGFERIYDRILMMCMCEKSPIAFTGESIRKRIANERFKGILEATVDDD